MAANQYDLRIISELINQHNHLLDRYQNEKTLFKQETIEDSIHTVSRAIHEVCTHIGHNDPGQVFTSPDSPTGQGIPNRPIVRWENYKHPGDSLRTPDQADEEEEPDPSELKW